MSAADDRQFALPRGLSGDPQCFGNIVGFEIGVGGENLRFRHAVRHIAITVATGMRNPRGQGTPPICYGSTVMRRVVRHSEPRRAGVFMPALCRARMNRLEILSGTDLLSGMSRTTDLYLQTPPPLTEQGLRVFSGRGPIEINLT